MTFKTSKISIKQSEQVVTFHHSSVQHIAFVDIPVWMEALTCNTPIVSANNFSITPFFFDRRMTVQPSRPVGPWWSIIVPSPKRMTKLYHLGKKNGHKAILNFQRTV